MRLPKYAVGDLVDFMDNKGIIKEVIEQYYFDGVDFYEYKVEMTETGALHTAPEAALSLVQAVKKAVFCECGAHAVHWAQNEHSYWCRAYKPFERKEAR